MQISIRTRIILYFIILIVISFGGLAIYLSNYFQRTYYERETTNLLSQTHRLAEQAASVMDVDSTYLAINSMAVHTSQVLRARFTVILPDGTVIADSSVDPYEMENHLNRPEVQLALAGSENSQTRYSRTLKVEMLYTAAPIYIDDQIIAVLRLAVPLSEVQESISAVQDTLLIIFIALTATTMMLALLLGKYTVKKLERLTSQVKHKGTGVDAIVFTPNSQKDEISQLDQAFNQLYNQIALLSTQITSEKTNLNALLHHMTDGILIAGEDGKVRLLNSAAGRMFNIGDGEGIGHSVVEILRHYQMVDLWQYCLKSSKQQSTTLEIAPERLFIHAIATPIEWDSHPSVLMAFQDLTRLRWLEVVRRDFVSNVSHELRTPLASIKAITETLLDGAMNDPIASRDFLNKMDQEIDNLSQIVQELLELSRIESGKVPLEKQRTSPKNLLTSSCSRMELQVERANLTIDIQCPENLPDVLADESRMEQVLVNLIHNAIKFTRPGGRITLNAIKGENQVIFSVQDTGTGIKTDVLPRIFERFYKADKSRSEAGTGLGLSIARHLVEAHGGKIWAESTPGIGSIFYFSLPVE